MTRVQGPTEDRRPDRIGLMYLSGARSCAESEYPGTRVPTQVLKTNLGGAQIFLCVHVAGHGVRPVVGGLAGGEDQA
jgi:hypothetical protein